MMLFFLVLLLTLQLGPWLIFLQVSLSYSASTNERTLAYTAAIAPECDE